MRTHFDSVFIWKHEVSNKLLPISLQTISENTGQLPLTKTDRHLKGISSDSTANSTELSETPSREKGLVEWRQCLALPRHCSPHTSSSQLDNNSCVPSSKAALLLNKKMKNYMHHSILCSKQGFFFIFSIVNSLCIFITHKYLANIPSYLLNKITFLCASHISLAMTRQDWYVQVILLTTTNKTWGERHTEAHASLSQVHGLEVISVNIEKERALLSDG